MGSRFFKSLFFGSSSSNHNNSLKGRSGAYESTVALEPPVKGSYPVAGNGPNVEETLQRARLKREARQNETRTSSLVGNIVSRVPSIVRKRGEDTSLQQRPRTAPHNGEPAGYNVTRDEDGRTRSGFSMRSPPSIFSSRRDSLRSAQSPPPTEPLPPLPTKQQSRPVQTYQPKKGPTPSSTPAPLSPQERPINGFIPPFAEKKHQRNFSQASHSSHVDLLDAYSSIRGRDTSKHRQKASGVRNYGEDVADRNIADFGDKDLQNLDLNSPEFGYLKSIYAVKKRQAGDGVASGRNVGDDTEHKTPATSSRISSAPRNAMTAAKAQDDQLAYVTSPGQSPGALSPVTASKLESIPAKNPRRKDSDPIDMSSLPRGRQIIGHSPAPVAPPHRISSLGQSPRVVLPVEESTRSSSLQSSSRVTSPIHSRQPSTNKAANHHGHPISRNSSVTYSAFPNTTSPRDNSVLDHASTLNSRPTANSSRRTFLADSPRSSPSVEGIVNLKNSVDTDVNTKTLPAVTHEFVQPIARAHRQEKITREIHTHDVFHRTQPIIQTEVLPAKHYIHAPDGKSLIEIPEDQIPGRTRAGAASQNWKITETPLGHGNHGASSSQHQRQRSSSLSQIPPQTIVNEEADYDDAAEPPVIGLARCEAHSSVKSRSRANSRASMHTQKSSRSKNVLEPLLAKNRESMSPEGVPRKEYLWRHQPQFENFSRPSSSRSWNGNPTYVGAGIGDISPEGAAAVAKGSVTMDFYYSDNSEEDCVIDGSKANKEKNQEGEEVLFRDSGYGGVGGLPGISEDGYAPAHPLVGELDRLRIAHRPRRSGGSGIGKEVLVERDGEDDSSDADVDEEAIPSEVQQSRKTRRYRRQVKVKRSSGDLRNVASKQEVDLRM